MDCERDAFHRCAIAVRRRLAVMAYAFCLLAGAGCDTVDDDGDEGRVVGGVDLAVLFAPPTEAELAAVRADWAERDVSVQGHRVERTDTVLVGSHPMVQQVVSHLVGSVRHYGAVLTPVGRAGDRLPVLVYAHGGDSGVELEEPVFLFQVMVPALDAFVYVIPSYRAEPLILSDERRYRSEGQPSPWDRDVDDLLALLNTTLATNPAADPARIAVLGLSRGGGVGLLAAVRDPRIDLVVEYFGPTDFFGPYIEKLAVEALEGRPRDLAGVNEVNALTALPLQQGRVTMAQARLELVRRSPAYFAAALPQVQVHHGTADALVEVSQSDTLAARMAAAGRTAPAFEYFRYPGGEHNPGTLFGSLQRTADVFAAFLSTSGLSTSGIHEAYP